MSKVKRQQFLVAGLGLFGASVALTLQGMGYEIVPVSKLIMTEDYHMDANGMQIKD